MVICGVMICVDGCTPTRMVMVICGVGHGCTPTRGMVMVICGVMICADGCTWVYNRLSDACTGLQKRRLPNGAIIICWQHANCAKKQPAPKAWMPFSGRLVPPHLANLLHQLAEQLLQRRQWNASPAWKIQSKRCPAQQGIICVAHAPTGLLRILNFWQGMPTWCLWVCNSTSTQCRSCVPSAEKEE